MAVHHAEEAGRGTTSAAGARPVAVAALRGLDLDVEVGEVAAVVGPSGSGKTTLLRIVAGAERPTAGSLSIFGVPLERASDAGIRRHRRGVVGLVDQHYRRALSPYLPAREIVALPLALRGVERSRRDSRVAELLDAVGLAGRGGARPAELSGGEQQRLAVAAALAIRPRLLLADEPTGELDAEATARLLTLIRDLVRAEGITALIVTHDAAVEAIADRVVVLQDGRAVAERRGPLGAAERPLVDGAGWHAPERTWRQVVTAPPESATSNPAAVVPSPTIALPADAAASMRSAAILLEGVTRRYDAGPAGITAIEGLSARIERGGVGVVTGPSGSGKSTLLRLVSGLDRPDDGRLVVLGTDLGTLDREGLAAFRARHVGIAEQARGLVPFLDVRENVSLSLAIRDPGSAGLPPAEAVDVLLARLGIDHLRARRPAELSAGERTRVAIARALVAGPELLLLDEPTATLDRVSAAGVAALLAELGRELTVLVATHDPALVAIAGTRLDLGAERLRPAPGARPGAAPRDAGREAGEPGGVGAGAAEPPQP